ncbi:MAG: sensor domain-containing diguanylate cyclase [Desulfobacterales bacterium]|nr:sensor domain-containing diguanylate cyclase [Desulfobacterales bacterium]MDJ0853947.1 sensor domain-containing diguanylate cyclase [Desulfobacterales bacterium]MDJ0887630.1 sensor domain-containing diguanylate cyclase [Desulfobacterales bacterium]MDJ0991130.1 sensor domain-containing diguanylate cyclase [Desulfobacterales bacterium]
MFENTAIYQEVLNNLYEGVYFLDTDRTISFWNQGAERITGYVAPEVIGRPCADDILCHLDQEGRSLCQEECPAARTLEDGEAREADVFLLHKNGHRVPVRIRVAPILDAGGRIIGAVEVFADNSSPETLRQRIDLLEKLTGLDPLTQLPNRRRLEEEIQARLAETQRYGLTFGILFADIDRFKTVNDTFGHATGDEVLKMVGNTMLNALRPFDIAGRWGGEEFLAVVVNVDMETLAGVAERMRSLVAQSRLPHEDGNITVTLSVGATLVLPGDDGEALLKRADKGLYRSKAGGRNQVTIA